MVRGSGGATFEVTPPALGSMARERFDLQLAKGEIEIIGKPGTAPQAAETAPPRPAPRGRTKAGDTAEAAPQAADTEGDDDAADPQ